jgi:hypothetical protein
MELTVVINQTNENSYFIFQKLTTFLISQQELKQNQS